MSSRTFGLLGSVIDKKRQIGRILFSPLPVLAYGHCVGFDFSLHVPGAVFELDWEGPTKLEAL